MKNKRIENLGLETEYIEFKESLSQLDKGLKSLSAMLNRHNEGTVYFGVKDNGDIVGLDIGSKTLEDIRHRAKELIKPKIIVGVEELSSSEGKKYIKLSSFGSDIPYSFDGRYFIRSVKSDEQIDNNILRKMLSSGENDLIKEAVSPIEELTFLQLRTILGNVGNHINNELNFEQSYELLNRQGKYNLMAYLLSDQNNVSIKVVEFSGKDKTTMSKRTEYGYKSLLLSVQNVQEYFRSINSTKVILENGTRKEVELFSFDGFHEAWINACVHNEWISMIPPSIYVFEDRIEIVSYGSLPFGLSKEKFFQGTSMPVNKALLRIFINASFAEQSGHGVPKIIETCGKNSINIGEGTISVVIPFNFETEASVNIRNAIGSLSSLTTNQRNVLNLLNKNPNLTLQEVALKLNISLGGVKKIINKLSENKLIVREGSKRKGYWKTIDIK